MAEPKPVLPILLYGPVTVPDHSVASFSKNRAVCRCGHKGTRSEIARHVAESMGDR